MACNSETCPSFVPDGRGLKGSANGVRMRRELFPKRNTKAINAPTWNRDCVMYYYTDLCEYPEANNVNTTETEIPGEPTGETDPVTGDPVLGESTYTYEEDLLGTAQIWGPNSGKVYKYLDTGIWWFGRGGCPTRTVTPPCGGTPYQENPVPVRYWDHAPSELSFEPNYSDCGWIYIWDTSTPLSGLPCHVICWTAVNNACANSETYTRSITYKPVRVPYYCDQTPDVTYVEYQTPDGKITDEDRKDPYPLIFGVGTEDNAIVYKDVGGCTSSMADVEIRLEGREDKEDYHRLGPWTKLFTRQGGSNQRELYSEAGEAEGFLDSTDEDHVYTCTAEARDGSTVVATVGISARPFQGIGDSSRVDSKIKITSLTKVGSTIPKAGTAYTLYAPREDNGNDYLLGEIRFTDISDPDAEETGCVTVGCGFQLYIEGEDNISSNYTNDDAWVDAEVGITVVNTIGSNVWTPGNSGEELVQEVYSFEGPDVDYGSGTGSGLKLEIKLEKLEDYESDRDTKVTIMRVISLGDGNYTEGDVFPIGFTRGGTFYKAGYLRMGGTKKVRGNIYKGVPSGWRVAEPRTDGGVFNVSATGWSSWANQYAVWTNNLENNLAGRGISIIYKEVTLPAGTYTLEFGASDSGECEILRKDTGAFLHQSGGQSGGLIGTAYSGTFTLAEETIVEVYIDVAKDGNPNWDDNPAGFAFTLTQGGTIEYHSRSADPILQGDAYVGTLLDETKWKIIWDGVKGQPFESTQGTAVWKTPGIETFRDYDFPGGAKIRFKLQSKRIDDTTYHTIWTMDQVILTGSGYNKPDADLYDKSETILADQDIFYIYYPSKDAPADQRISLGVMVSEVFTAIAPNEVDELRGGTTLNGWTVDEVHIPNDEMPYRVALLSGDGNKFVKDDIYTAGSGVGVQVIAGWGIKDRAALVGQYEFNKKQISYLTARMWDDVPFFPEVIYPEVSAVVNNGRIIDVQITRAGYNLNDNRMEPIVLIADDPPTLFDHRRFQDLLIDGEVATVAYEACEGTGRRAVLKPLITNGSLVGVTIEDGGAGYSSTNPPKIRVPYLVRRDNNEVWPESSATESEPSTKALFDGSPVFKNLAETPYKRVYREFDEEGNLTNEEVTDLKGFDFAEYELLKQPSYTAQYETIDRTALKSLDLTDIPRTIKLEGNIKNVNNGEMVVGTLSPEYLDQFDDRGKTEYAFSETTETEYAAAIEQAPKTFDAFRKQTEELNNNETIPEGAEGPSVSAAFRDSVDKDFRVIARNGQSVAATKASPSPDIPEKNLEGDGAKLGLTGSSAVSNDIGKITFNNNREQTGPNGDLDHYSTDFRNYLTQDVETPDEIWNLGESKGPERNLGLGFDEQKYYDEAGSYIADVTGPGGPSAGPREKVKNNNFDLAQLDKINKQYDDFIDLITEAKTDAEKQWETVETRIDTVTGGFYNLPCADYTNGKLYIMQDLCIDQRVNTFITVKLGVKYGQVAKDHGRCTQCLYDNPTVVSTYEANEGSVDGYTIQDAFCAVRPDYVGNVVGVNPLYTPAYFITYYNNIVVEGIRDWEIEGSLEILQDFTQQAKMWSQCCKKYGNPYDGLCGRTYGDLGENYRFSPTLGDELADDDLPSQLNDPIIEEQR